jgi:hypothetical protein
MVEASSHRPRYERSDVDPRLVGALALGVAAFLVAAPLILLAAYPSSRREPAPPLAEAPPAPRLQLNPHAELETLRAAERKRLSSYGWVDHAGGVVHLPIDRALALTAERGLPGWPKP